MRSSSAAKAKKTAIISNFQRHARPTQPTSLTRNYLHLSAFADRSRQDDGHSIANGKQQQQNSLFLMTPLQYANRTKTPNEANANNGSILKRQWTAIELTKGVLSIGLVWFWVTFNCMLLLPGRWRFWLKKIYKHWTTCLLCNAHDLFKRSTICA